MKRRVLLAISGALAIGWQVTLPGAAGLPATPTASPHSGGIMATAGAGHYLLQGAFDVQFAFVALQFGNGRAVGHFRHRTEDETGTIDFSGEVTCLAVDSINRRAWIGGVITANRSTSPSFTTLAIHEVGHDIWFRVLDNDHGSDEPDRSTFVGFESDAIPSSEAYCSMRIWPDVPVINARTWPVTSGNLVVDP
jgi:hypothetical protein